MKPPTEPRPVIAQAAGAAVTGAVLSFTACQALAATGRRRERACSTTDGMCFTWWDVAVLPLTFAAALAVLSIVYKALGIGPRIGVIPPSLLLAPLPLGAADSIGGRAAVTVAGALWACFLALAARKRHRMLGLSLTAVVLLASLIVLYRPD
ncbi:hypothetical protein ACFY9A_38375 [Streptomyces rubradiris]|uniref:hypothetical protein n=1 Tax=Streptomyces rubradiris TaxID=285531 RepID=UPI0036E8FF72